MMEEDLDADDPYDVIDLSREATQDEVKDRVRNLLGKYSDDHAARTTINDAFEEIQKRPGPIRIHGTTVVPLLVSANPETIEVGEEVTVRVTDHRGDPVSGADIHVKDQARGRSNDDGVETLRLNDAGVLKITVQARHSEPDYEFRDGAVEVFVEE